VLSCRDNEIIDRVWRGVLVTDTVISRAVYQIRKAMGNGGDGPPIIETIPKRGYRCAWAARAAHADFNEPPLRSLRLAVLPFED